MAGEHRIEALFYESQCGAVLILQIVQGALGAPLFYLNVFRKFLLPVILPRKREGRLLSR